MVREENIETASNVARIIPASTTNSDYCSIVIIARNNQPEPIYPEVTNLDINQELAITPQEAPKMVINMIMAEANDLKKNKELTPPQEASVDIQKASQKAYNNVFQHKEYQILSDMWQNFMNSYLTVRKILGHPNTYKLLNGWYSLMEKKNMMLLTAEWRKNNPCPPNKVPKTAPVARRSNSNIKKKPQAQNKGKGKETATKPYRQGYIIPRI
ncbi:hypothetical protein O181_035204 [Austropuccinia psidii MF-1]|uniref:Uncharacterized protein n=1 Tax=Austropuccinia psidii MF-1 TaxID=1389203 RepID=A0A9Q3HAA9_9BASI|nr:hypothetical protein [Austropuccinia psidii MF-1]